MVLKGRLAELMVQVAPNLFRKNITVNRNGTAILYVKMQKALYGLLRSVLLFFNKLMANLESDGFVLNPYDSYVRLGQSRTVMGTNGELVVLETYGET